MTAEYVFMGIQVRSYLIINLRTQRRNLRPTPEARTLRFRRVPLSVPRPASRCSVARALEPK